MDVFIRNVPPTVGDKELKNFLAPHIQSLSIPIFACQKSGAKYANITFLNLHDARTFLSAYGQGSKKFAHLKVSGAPLYFSESTKPADKFMLRSLDMEAKKQREMKNAAQHHRHQENVAPLDEKSFDVSSASCGSWAYIKDELVFSAEVTWKPSGQLTFGKRGLRIVLQSGHRIDMAYSSIESFTIGGFVKQSLTISCFWAPKFSIGHGLEGLLASLVLSTENKLKPRTRITSLGSSHEKIAPSCLVYRFELMSTSNDQLQRIKLPLEIPPAIFHRTKVHRPHEQEGFAVQFQRMTNAFTTATTNENFPILFQLQKLAQNGYLSPQSVIELLPETKAMSTRSSIPITAEALRKLFNDLPFRGPETDAKDFSLDNLIEWLRYHEARAKDEDSYRLQSLDPSRNSNRASVFRAKVTPVGVYLYGPSPETKNRVMRRYSGHLDYFLRVEFCDEDGQQVRYDPRLSNDEIFYQRFEKVLQEGINIAGRVYGFLGYSHSSLRAQMCWFMAPFVADRELIMYQKLIADLGDFSHIQSPAKCAARIGQTFSDTPVIVPLTGIPKVIEDVERNGRVFSDGVGTFSESVLYEIWDALSSKRQVKPTVFQIRHGGAKGMISLDNRLQDHVLNLRQSMIKFVGSNSLDIEICGAAWKPLPMFLNRQMIKIMEDLGVNEQFFLDLQAEAVERLQDSLITDSKAADFLSRKNVGEIVRLPRLIKQLMSLSLSFKNDSFLQNIVKTAAMIELRALKHKSRILVEKGYTLYGIMDETDTLREGEVFVTYDTPSYQQRVLVQDGIIVTRSPALHPGDIRVANAVDVPPDSPLRALANCIVFSQRGQRDLPSQLSGGDLDGDLYNIIYDHRVHLDFVHEPADYPRQQALDLGRAVTREDMTDFFITFMATDQLGRIATAHMIKADQSEKGTFDSDCIKLAELHSTAVDYSKTGIPVDLRQMPKYSRVRPDFLAPGPNVKITKKGEIDFDEPTDQGQDDEDFQPYSYYESHKILGKLYRAIDEEKVFHGVDQMSQSRGVSVVDRSALGNNVDVMASVFRYVKQECKSLLWGHLLDSARNIREEYDDLMLKIMSEYCQHPLHPVSETEVLAGNIVGKTGAQTKQQKEMSITMKERFDEDVSYIMNKIVREKAEPSMEALERSVACFQVSFELGRVRNKGNDQLVSFKYVAAGLCLRELDRCRGGNVERGTVVKWYS